MIHPSDTADEVPEQSGAEPWSAHLPGQEPVPSYLTSSFAAQYRVIVEVLLAAQDSSLTGLSYDEIVLSVHRYLETRLGAETAAALAGTDRFHLDARLERLAQWNVVTQWQEPARTGEDFLRRRDRYQLTPLAASLHAFWQQAEQEADGDSADITLAPRAIHDRLVAFSAALRSADYPAAASEFQQVSTLHRAMAGAARGWQRTLAHSLSGGPDEAKQEMLWRALRSYVGAWGEQVDVHSPQIAELMASLAAELTENVWRACVRATLGDDPDDEQIAHDADRWQWTWAALASWFGGADSQARRLRRQLRDVIAPWARNMHILMDTGGAVTRRAELIRLATAIEQAPDDETAWRIWGTALGVFGARHLLLVAEAADDHTRSWAESPAAPVTARYREHGARAAVGRRTKISDYSTGRAAARRHRESAIAERNSAEATLRQRSGTSLGSWGELTDSELGLLLELLGAARRIPGESQRSAVTADGRWLIRLTPPDRYDDMATLTSPRGHLVTVNWRLDLEPT